MTQRQLSVGELQACCSSATPIHSTPRCHWRSVQHLSSPPPAAFSELFLPSTLLLSFGSCRRVGCGEHALRLPLFGGCEKDGGGNLVPDWELRLIRGFQMVMFLAQLLHCTYACMPKSPLSYCCCLALWTLRSSFGRACVVRLFFSCYEAECSFVDMLSTVQRVDFPPHFGFPVSLPFSPILQLLACSSVVWFFTRNFTAVNLDEEVQWR